VATPKINGDFKRADVPGKEIVLNTMRYVLKLAIIMRFTVIS